MLFLSCDPTGPGGPPAAPAAVAGPHGGSCPRPGGRRGRWHGGGRLGCEEAVGCQGSLPGATAAADGERSFPRVLAIAMAPGSTYDIKPSEISIDRFILESDYYCFNSFVLFYNILFNFRFVTLLLSHLF